MKNALPCRLDFFLLSGENRGEKFEKFIKILKSSIDKRNIFDIMNNVLKSNLKKCGI